MAAADDMWAFLLGLGTMAGFLVAIGVTRNRILSLRAWTALWTGASLAFAALLVAAFLTGDAFTLEIVLGGATGYVLSVGMHTLHHYMELRAKETQAMPPDPSAEGIRIRRRIPILASLLVFHAWLWGRMFVSGEMAFVLLLAIPVAFFAVRLAGSARRYKALRRAAKP